MNSNQPTPQKRYISIFNRDFDRRFVATVAVVAVCAVLGNAFFIHAAWPTNVRVEYEPDQPIEFSHQLHAGSLQIDCRYCHTGVDTGAHATVPPVSTCMTCHSQFDPDPAAAITAEDKALQEEQKRKIDVLKAKWDEGEAVEWNKVYDLADFVYFNHSRHTGAGIDCRTCHGPVETMDKIRKHTPLTMGWCLTCHKGNREVEAGSDPILVDEYMKQHRGWLATTEADESDPHLAQLTGELLTTQEFDVYGEMLAPINCSTCHR